MITLPAGGSSAWSALSSWLPRLSLSLSFSLRLSPLQSHPRSPSIAAPSRRMRRRTRRWPGQRPVRLLHLLDGLFTQASLARHSTGVGERRQMQRLALTQRLLDPLPSDLVQSGRGRVLFWEALRWGTAGLVLAWLLRP